MLRSSWTWSLITKEATSVEPINPRWTSPSWATRGRDRRTIQTVKSNDTSWSLSTTCWLGRLGPIMCMNLNRSNIIHYYQLGCPVEYLIINPRDPGEVSRVPTSFQGRSFKCSSQGVVGGVHTYSPGLNWELALMDILLRVRPWLRSWIWLCW